MITYNDIYEALRKEKYSDQLQQISKKFVSEVSNYLSEKKKSVQDDDGIFSDEIMKTKKQIENARTIFDELMMIRKKKLLGLVFVASETGISKRDFENMLDFEREMFDKVLSSVKDADKILQVQFTSQNFEHENPMKLILFLNDVDPFVGFDGEELGPFYKGDMLNVKKEIADILVEDGKAEEIHDE